MIYIYIYIYLSIYLIIYLYWPIYISTICLLQFPGCRCQKLWRVCLAGQIQPRKRVLDRADHTAPTRQHERDHTDHTVQPTLKI